MRGFWGNKGRERAAEETGETRDELAEQAASLLAYTRKPEAQATLRVCRGNETAMAVRNALAGGGESFHWNVEAAGVVMGGRVDALLVRMVRAGLMTTDDLLILAMASLGRRIEMQGGVCGCPKCQAQRAGANGGATRPGRVVN